MHAMVGSRSGETYRLGDRVTVKLVEAAPVAGALRFELLSEGRRSATRRAATRGFARSGNIARSGTSRRIATSGTSAAGAADDRPAPSALPARRRAAIPM